MSAVSWILPLLAVIGNLSDLNDRLVRRFEREQSFSVTATVVSVSENLRVGRIDPDRQRNFHVSDGNRLAVLSQDGDERMFPQSGDVVRFDGRLKRERWGWCNARVERWLKVGSAPVPEPIPIAAAALSDADSHNRYVRMQGVLADVIPDDIDARNAWLVLRSREGVILASIGRRTVESREFPAIGDRIELVGRANARPSAGRRHFQSARLDVIGPNPVRLLEKAPADPFAVPGVDGLDYVTADALERLSLRKAEGRVVALPSSGRLLLRTDGGRIVGAEVKGGAMPSVGEAESGETAVAVALRLKPDVVIMDLMMPGIGGTEAIRRLMRTEHPPRVLVLSSYGQSAEMARAVAAGAAGALAKDAPMEELATAVRRVSSGRKYLSRDVAGYLDANPLPTFTEREKKILLAISKGLTNEDIAEMLGLSVPRIKQHLKDLFVRLGVANRTEAAAYVLREGLV